MRCWIQVLANLMSNACKYSSEGTDVTIKAETIGDMAIVYVQNFGPGVPENFKNRIFQAFSQADGSDTRAKLVAAAERLPKPPFDPYDVVGLDGDGHSTGADFERAFEEDMRKRAAAASGE